MRATHSHTRNRRSHHKLQDLRLSTCSECQSLHLRHTLCEKCGTYRGSKVVDVDALQQKKLEREIRKKKMRGEETEE